MQQTHCIYLKMGKLKEMLSQEGYANLVEIPNQGLCGILHLMFTFGLCTGLTKFGYDRRYCYHSEKEATDALVEWTGESEHPSGNWIKCKGSCVDLRNPLYISKEIGPIAREM